MKPYLTSHARERFDERFPDHDIQAEYDAAVPFGPSIHGSAYMLSPCGAVFAITKSAVTTVLTKQHVLGNIQASFPSGHLVSIDPPPTSRRQSVSNLSAVQAVAIQHAQEDHEAGRVVNNRDRARRNVLLRQAIDKVSDGLQKSYVREYTKERQRLAGMGAAKA